jgi:hypothetical protein
LVKHLAELYQHAMTASMFRDLTERHFRTSTLAPSISPKRNWTSFASAVRHGPKS